MSPRQTSDEFREQKTRSLIGFGLYYKEENEVKCINVDLVSSPLGQTGYDTVEAFR